MAWMALRTILRHHLNQLLLVGGQRRQAGVAVAANGDALRVFGQRQRCARVPALREYSPRPGCACGWCASRRSSSCCSRTASVGDDVAIFFQIRPVGQFVRQQLRSAADTIQRVFDFVRQDCGSAQRLAACWTQQAFFVAIFSCCSIGRSSTGQTAQPATLIGVSVQMTCSEIWLMVFE